MNIDQILNSSDDGEKAKRLKTNDDQTERPTDIQSGLDTVPSDNTHESFKTTHRASWPDIRKRKHSGPEGDRNRTDSRWRPSHTVENSSSSRYHQMQDSFSTTHQSQHTLDADKHYRHSVHSISTQKPLGSHSQSPGIFAATLSSSDSTPVQQRDLIDSKEQLSRTANRSKIRESLTASNAMDEISSSSSAQNIAENYSNVDSSTSTSLEDSERKSRSKRSKAKNSQWTFEEDHKLVSHYLQL